MTISVTSLETWGYDAQGNLQRTRSLTGASSSRRSQSFKLSSIDEKSRRATFVAATENGVLVHGQPEWLRMSGARLERYRKNPVVVDSHKTNEAGAVIGRGVDVHVDGANLVATVEFATTKRAEEIWQLVRTGFLRGVSVGFTPLRRRELRSGEREGDSIGPGVVVPEWELDEISITAVPLDEDALRRAKNTKGGEPKKETRNMLLEAVRKKLGLPEDADEAAAAAAIEAMQMPGAEGEKEELSKELAAERSKNAETEKRIKALEAREADGRKKHATDLVEQARSAGVEVQVLMDEDERKEMTEFLASGDDKLVKAGRRLLEKHNAAVARAKTSQGIRALPSTGGSSSVPATGAERQRKLDADKIRASALRSRGYTVEQDKDGLITKETPPARSAR